MITRGIILQPEMSIDIEPDALTLYDLSRYGNDGTMLAAGQPNAVQLPSDLWVWDYDGINDYINFANDTFNFLNMFSIEFYLNLDTVGANQFIWSTFVDANNNCHLQSVGAGVIQFFLRATAGLGIQWQTTILTALQYDHIIFTYPAVAGQLAHCYLNGVEQFNVAFGSRTVQNSVSFRDLVGVQANYIGRQAGAGFMGAVVGMSNIYGYMLTAGQALQRYESSKYLFGVHD